MHAVHRFMCIHVLICLAAKGLGSEIINGKIAPENTLLYMTSVQNNHNHVCGGFLVTKDFVVTAAHCDEGNPVKVILGTHNLKKPGKTERRIVKKCKHPSYVNVGAGNDIMLLRLSNEVQLTKSIQLIQLPSSVMKLKENETCQVAGWGVTETYGETVEKLRVVNVSVINPQVCKEAWNGIIPDNVTCAGGYGTKKGFCQGDSGGPLVCNGMAVGVVSFNKYSNCNYPDVPNIYTDISKYLNWINKILKKNNC